MAKTWQGMLLGGGPMEMTVHRAQNVEIWGSGRLENEYGRVHST